MKKLTQKFTDKDKGIAIIFSLVMLMIFFFLSFGFLATVSTAKSAANARAPKDNANLIASSRILVQAVRGLEALNGLTTNGNAYLTAPNPQKLVDLEFTNGTTPVTFYCWGTNTESGGTHDNSTPDLKDYLTMHFETGIGTTGDYKPTGTGNWSKFGWVTKDLDGNSVDDKYAWLVIHSDALDANYIGGDSTGAVTGERDGLYIRELDIGEIAPTYRYGQADAVYAPWGYASSNTPWLHKKKLVASLTASNLTYETAVQSLQVGTSPISIVSSDNNPAGDPKFDLNTQITDTTALSDIQDNLPWLVHSTNGANNILTANLKDLCDPNNLATHNITNTTAPTTASDLYCGNERVPYINEASLGIYNITDYTVATNDTRVSIDAHAELVNIFQIVSNWGSAINGSAAKVTINYTISCKLDGDTTASTFERIIDMPIDLTTATAGGYYPLTTTATTVTLKSGSSVSIADVTLTIKSIVLYGSGITALTDIWDYAQPELTSSNFAVLNTPASTSTYNYFAVEIADSRNNLTGWTETPGSPDTTLANAFSSGTANSTYLPATWSDKEEDLPPWQLSTSYMPSEGDIRDFSELGFISRGATGETINLTKYNINSRDEWSTYADGDRSILHFVTLSNYSPPTYKQYGAVNPNTTDKNTLTLLLRNVRPYAGPYSEDYDGDKALATTGTSKTTDSDLKVKVAALVERFPLITEMANTTATSRDPNNQLTYDDFHGVDKTDHNPSNIGDIFYEPTWADTDPEYLTDAEQEAFVMKTKNLMSTKYSYFTILGAVELNSGGSYSKLYAFVRRNNETGKITLIRKSVL